jgi:hypothetical protein
MAVYTLALIAARGISPGTLYIAGEKGYHYNYRRKTP